MDPEPAKYRFGPESLDSYLNILELAEQIVGVDRKNGVQADLLAGLQYSFWHTVESYLRTFYDSFCIYQYKIINIELSNFI